MAGPTALIRENCPNATESYDGLMSAQDKLALDELTGGTGVIGTAGPKIYSLAARPVPNDPIFATVLGNGQVGVIWNSDTQKPNYTDGTAWYNADGTLA